jgi:AcrR family transcriptional regulator
MASRSDPKDLRTRDEILTAAGQLFAERGFANVSIRDICDAAGVTPPTVYYYFGNKERLFQAVIRGSLSLDGFRVSLAEAVQRHSEPDAQLGAFIHHYLASMPRGFFNPGMFLNNTTQLTEFSTDRVRSEFEAIDELARQSIAAGMESGMFKQVDLDRATEYLMNLLMAYVLGEVHYGQSHEPDETSRFITDMFLNGLRGRI